MPKELSVRDRDYERLKAWCAKHDVSMAETVGQLVKKLEVKKLETLEKTIKQVAMDTCDECGEEVPSDSDFCPYCGVEFEPDDEDDSD